MALAASKSGIALLSAPSAKTQNDKKSRLPELFLLSGDALLGQGKKAQADESWRSAIALLSADSGQMSLRSKINRFRLLKRLGRRNEASAIAAELNRSGFRHPAFTQEL